MKMMNEKQNVEALLQNFADAYTERNIAEILGLFTTKHPIILLGTGADERMNSIEDLKKQFTLEWSLSDRAEFDLGEIQSHVIDDAAWICAHSTIHVWINGKKRTYSCMRNTHMLIKEHDVWQFCISHWSLPANQQLGNPFP